MVRARLQWVIGLDAAGRQQWERMFLCGSLIPAP